MSHEHKKNFGTISIPIALVGSLLMASIAGMAAYYGTVNAQNEKVATVKQEVYSDFSLDRQRITAVETDVKTIKESQLRVETDIRELLRRIK